MNSDANEGLIKTIKRSVQLGFLIYASTTMLAFWFPIIALAINLLLWIVWISLSINAK